MAFLLQEAASCELYQYNSIKQAFRQSGKMIFSIDPVPGKHGTKGSPLELDRFPVPQYPLPNSCFTNVRLPHPRTERQGKRHRPGLPDDGPGEPRLPAPRDDAHGLGGPGQGPHGRASHGRAGKAGPAGRPQVRGQRPPEKDPRRGRQRRDRPGFRGGPGHRRDGQ
ncbi:MAG: hypothetical protein MZU97_07660 [Bacillus subtilis]|nr:hypothetical protein [Bacillus subtilis]